MSLRKCFWCIICLLSGLSNASSQSLKDIVEEINLDSLMKTVSELSGEVPIIVNGKDTFIKHRVSPFNNDLAADYLFERLQALGLDVEKIRYRESGVNIVATIKGTTSPDSIYLYCAHYDSVTDFCADDNASGCASVLETARIMSQHCFKNTMVFAFWDEEELGLIGSKHFADSLARNGITVLGALNNDMMAYDSDSNYVFDIHADTLAQNVKMKDTLLHVLEELDLDLSPILFLPGTRSSDHGSFWRNDFPAVYFGESFFGGDRNPSYHRNTDRIDLFNQSYYEQLAKLAAGFAIELAGYIPPNHTSDTISGCNSLQHGDSMYFRSTVITTAHTNSLGCDSFHSRYVKIIPIDASVEVNGDTLLSIERGVSYQWFDCSDNEIISDAVSYYYLPKDFRTYKLVMTKEGCIDTSHCIQGTSFYSKSTPFAIYPNPTNDEVMVLLKDSSAGIEYSLYNLVGQEIVAKEKVAGNRIIIKHPGSSGEYVLRLQINQQAFLEKIIFL